MKKSIILLLMACLFSSVILALPVKIQSSLERVILHEYAQTGEHSRSIEVIILESKQIILFYGGFSKKGHETAMKLISKLKRNKDTYLYLERGYGGSVNDHKNFIQAIQNKCDPKQGCLLTTHLAGRCSSMCITLFLSGEQRIAENNPNSKLGFHRTLIRVGKKSLPIRSQRAMANYFSKFSGVNKKYVYDNRSILFGGEKNSLAFVSGHELLVAGFADELNNIKTNKSTYLEIVHGMTLVKPN